ncbi:CD3324 family protein [Alkalihalobacillus oceani]|uniref:CD3324 family protein n=1 Tax=Halalkalibacter oceani TaxID=1653776 RepID=A0A9X2DQW5_9BACI|nr:CD3324 family protein [Halalkalibacter oceani]MCM3714767.1 CD3324 family protein [Halalkalibacter oceani]
MKYVKASHVLPEKLIKEIQKYVQGDMIYIPKPAASRERWGSQSGERKRIDRRNDAIRQSYADGRSVAELAARHCLSVDTIKKIIYSKRS